MFCPECGTENDGSNKFCKACGKSLDGGKVNVNIDAIAEKVKSRAKGLSPKALIGVGALIALAIIIGFMVKASRTIKLDDYVIVEFKGENGEGRGYVRGVDWDKLQRDYGDKLKFDYESLKKDYAYELEKENLLDKISLVAPVQWLMAAVDDVDLDEDESLKNGQKVKLVWEFKDDVSKMNLFKYFNYKFEFGTRTIKVKGLE